MKYILIKKGVIVVSVFRVDLSALELSILAVKKVIIINRCIPRPII